MNIKTLFDKIEENIGNAYEVGHAHGGNAFRMMQGSKSERVDEGWCQYFEAIKKDITDYIAGATEAQDDWKRVEDEMRSLLKYIGEKGYYVNDDGSVWKDAFLYGKEIDVVAEYRNLPSPPSNDKKESA